MMIRNVVVRMQRDLPHVSVAKDWHVDTPSMEPYLCVHEHVYTWCQEGWRDIYCHVWPRTVPRTVLAVALLREDARAIISLKAIELVRSLAGHVSYLACPLRCIILFAFYLHCRAIQNIFPRCLCVF